MLSLESTGARMSHLARQEIYFGRQLPLDEILGGIEPVDGRRRAARRGAHLRRRARRERPRQPRGLAARGRRTCGCEPAASGSSGRAATATPPSSRAAARACCSTPGSGRGSSPSGCRSAGVDPASLDAVCLARARRPRAGRRRLLGEVGRADRGDARAPSRRPASPRRSCRRSSAIEPGETRTSAASRSGPWRCPTTRRGRSPSWSPRAPRPSATRPTSATCARARGGAARLRRDPARVELRPRHAARRPLPLVAQGADPRALRAPVERRRGAAAREGPRRGAAGSWCSPTSRARTTTPSSRCMAAEEALARGGRRGVRADARRRLGPTGSRCAARAARRGRASGSCASSDRRARACYAAPMAPRAPALLLAAATLALLACVRAGGERHGGLAPRSRSARSSSPPRRSGPGTPCRSPPSSRRSAATPCPACSRCRARSSRSRT